MDRATGVRWTATALGVLLVHVLILGWWLELPLPPHRVGTPGPSSIPVVPWVEAEVRPPPIAPKSSSSRKRLPETESEPTSSALVPEAAQTTSSPALAPNLSEEVPPSAGVEPPQGPASPPSEVSAPSPEPDYLPQAGVTTAPVVPTQDLLTRIRYPERARKQGVQGTVVLELLIDQTGIIRRIEVIGDPGWGFAPAAVRALEGLVCRPARVDGHPVAVRFRYPVRFVLR